MMDEHSCTQQLSGSASPTVADSAQGGPEDLCTADKRRQKRNARKKEKKKLRRAEQKVDGEEEGSLRESPMLEQI